MNDETREKELLSFQDYVDDLQVLNHRIIPRLIHSLGYTPWNDREIFHERILQDFFHRDYPRINISKISIDRKRRNRK